MVPGATAGAEPPSLGLQHESWYISLLYLEALETGLSLTCSQRRLQCPSSSCRFWCTEGERAALPCWLALLFRPPGQLRNLWAPSRSGWLVHSFLETLHSFLSLPRARDNSSLPAAGLWLRPSRPTDIKPMRLMGWRDREPRPQDPSPGCSFCSASVFSLLSPPGTSATLQP